MPTLDPDWRQHAACAGMKDTFFPRTLSYTLKWEVEAEESAKEKCRICPVIEPCLELGLQRCDFLGHRDIESVGVFGGMNRFERRWLVKSPEEATALSALLVKEGIDPFELAAYQRAVGPPDLDPEMTVAEASIKYGVSNDVVHRWAKDRGFEMTKPTFTPWGRVIRETLVAAPDKWHPKPLLVAEAGLHIPDERIADKQELLRKRKRKATPQVAIERIIDGVLRTGVRRGHFLRRESPESGAVEFKMAPES